MLHPQQRCPGCCAGGAAAKDAAAGTQVDPMLLDPRVVRGPFLSRDRECQAQTGICTPGCFVCVSVVIP